MATFIYLIYAVALGVLFVWGVRLYRQVEALGMIFVLIPIPALIFETLVLALGHLIGEGALLDSLNRFRFLFHAVLTPLWYVAAFDYARRSGVEVLGRSVAQVIIWVVALVLVIYAFFTRYFGLVLEPGYFAGMLHYSRPPGGDPPLAALTIVILIGVAGVLIWRKIGWPWLFISAVIMFLGSAVPRRFVGPLLGSGVEIVMGTVFMLTEQQLQQREAEEDREFLQAVEDAYITSRR